MKARLPFILSLWTAIFVALLSALAPLGPPSSRLTGSAFNPATTSVLIKAHDPEAAPVLKMTDPDGGDQSSFPPIGISWLLPPALLLGGFRSTQSLARLVLIASPPWVSALLSRWRARAPPSLF